MTYVEFLARFIGIPLVVLLLLTWRDRRLGQTLPLRLSSWPVRAVILAHIVLAVLYTTPWDNYLVATDVWWYNPHLVTGLVLGWVPIEEYTFFVLQTLAMGLLIVFLAKRLPLPAQPITPLASHPRLRAGAAAAVATFWLAALLILLSEWVQGTYLALILVWALPPVILQMALGADILWRYRTLIFWTLVPATLYLGLVDSLAIGAGTWVIDPDQSSGLLLGRLPLEEGVFFLMTNLLVVFGMVLVLAAETQQRAPVALIEFLRRLTGRSTQQQGLSHV
jgi:lycopene cyclase domain-containing protein